jgi:TetR/AcrR family transcriptional regulator
VVPQAPNRPPRLRRSRADIRERLLDSALVEFGAKGFDGASTRAIARRADAHQPQINYHFASKEALWFAAVDHLFELFGRAMDGIVYPEPDDLPAVADALAEVIRRFVRFTAAHPELHRIMMHEATEASERLTWVIARHVRPFYGALMGVWGRLRAAGIAAPIDDAMIHHVLTGAVSFPFVSAPAVRLLTGTEPTDPAWIERHADGVVATFLPGL